MIRPNFTDISWDGSDLRVKGQSDPGEVYTSAASSSRSRRNTTAETRRSPGRSSSRAQRLR